MDIQIKYRKQFTSLISLNYKYNLLSSIHLKQYGKNILEKPEYLEIINTFIIFKFRKRLYKEVENKRYFVALNGL